MFTQAFIAGIDTPVLACKDCGALVWFEFRQEHVAFHARLARLERANASA